MRIERSSISLELDSRGKRVLKTVNHALGPILEVCTVIDTYLLEGIPGLAQELIEEIFLDPVAQRMVIGQEAVWEILPQWDLRVEVAYKPGACPSRGGRGADRPAVCLSIPAGGGRKSGTVGSPHRRAPL